MMVSKTYYYLTGWPGKIEAALSAPMDYALEWANDAKKEKALFFKIKNYAVALFIALAALPLKLVGLVLYWYYREAIHPHHMAQETEKWNQIILPESCGGSDQ